MFKGKKCQRCGGKIKNSFDFCPYCGLDLMNPERDEREFGLLGKNNHIKGFPLVGGMGGFGISDKMINTLFNSLAKSLEKQMQGMDPEVRTMPNGIQISLGPVAKKKQAVRKQITQEQIQRMSGLPRVEAKSSVRRLSDRIVYDLNAPGIENVEDVFVSRLEKGYEVKAIGKKKVYVNSIPVNLPLKGYSITEDSLKVEFALQ